MTNEPRELHDTDLEAVSGGLGKLGGRRGFRPVTTPPPAPAPAAAAAKPAPR